MLSLAVGGGDGVRTGGAGGEDGDAAGVAEAGTLGVDRPRAAPPNPLAC